MLSLVLLNLLLKVLGTNPPEFFLTGENFELCFNVVNLLSLSLFIFLLIDKNKIPVSQNLLYVLKSLIGGLTISLHVTY